jgi:hypothetical protein
MARTRKEQLILDLQRQRGDLTCHFRVLKGELSPGHQLQLSLRRHPFRWAAAAAGSGFLTSRLLLGRKADRRNPEKQRRRFFLGTGKLLFSLARPTLSAFALKKMEEHLETRESDPSGNSMLGGPPQK